MTEKKQSLDPDQEQSTKKVARFLFDLLVTGSASLVLKMAWNLGLASLVPSKIPEIGFMNALAWLTMLYIFARVVSAGYMAEVERTVGNLVDELGDALKKLFPVPVKKNEEDYDSSDMN